jgi:hypothetical protein
MNAFVEYSDGTIKQVETLDQAEEMFYTCKDFSAINYGPISRLNTTGKFRKTSTYKTSVKHGRKSLSKKARAQFLAACESSIEEESEYRDYFGH